jgi:hypothetical protein
VTLTGCVELPLVPADWSAGSSTQRGARPSGPVVASEINENNASEMADALREELEREAKQDKPKPDGRVKE